MLCDSVGIEPAPNNGTLRLPLKPVGLHKPEETPEEPADPVSTQEAVSSGPKEPARPTVPEKPAQPTRPTIPEKPAQPERPKLPVAPSKPAEASISQGPSKSAKPSKSAAPSSKEGDEDSDSDSDSDDDADDDEEEGWWDWITHKVGKVWHKLTGEDSE